MVIAPSLSTFSAYERFPRNALLLAGGASPYLPGGWAPDERYTVLGGVKGLYRKGVPTLIFPQGDAPGFAVSLVRERQL